MRFVRTLAVLALLLPLAVSAQAPSPDGQVTMMPDTSASATRDGFSAAMIITADPDWQKQWETPADVTPAFTLATEMRVGGALYILVFLSNPSLDDQRMTDVSCDLRVTRPDGQASGEERDVSCFKTALSGDPAHVYLSTVGVKFDAEPGDPPGTWTVAINVRDNLRGITVPLQSSFQLR
ncbi:hypothetical protein KQ945_00140 [Bacillus subtilis subsp. subtilis]|nr:hypothetical protein [Bacillus subtilis subsp. subtilis]